MTAVKSYNWSLGPVATKINFTFIAVSFHLIIIIQLWFMSLAQGLVAVKALHSTRGSKYGHWTSPARPCRHHPRFPTRCCKLTEAFSVYQHANFFFSFIQNCASTRALNALQHTPNGARFWALGVDRCSKIVPLVLPAFRCTISCLLVSFYQFIREARGCFISTFGFGSTIQKRHQILKTKCRKPMWAG